jgi:hypothetical protein
MAAGRRLGAVLATFALLAGLLSSAPVGAAMEESEQPRQEDPQSDNIKQLAKVPIRVPGEDQLAEGSDLAFQGNTLVAGSFSHGMALYTILPRAPYLRQESLLVCPGPQADVSIWDNLVFISVDGPRADEECGSPAGSAAAAATDTAWNGIRIIDISNKKNPRQVATVHTDCGSHTHTLVPKGRNLYIYVSSYPLGGQGAGCNAASHRKISVIEVNQRNPARSEVVSTPNVPGTAIGCHDITVLPERDLAFAACISESQVWDISDPTQPEILSRIYNPFIQIHHSTGVTWDLEYAVIGDEFSGAVGNGCLGSEDSPVGATWYYNISDPTSPQLAGYFGPPRAAPPRNAAEASYSRCTSHNFNVIPMKNRERYIMTHSYYTAGLSVIDFSDPSNPEEIAYYVPMTEDGNWPSLWSAYWYNGRIYAIDFEARQGVLVYEVDGLKRPQTRFFRGRLNPQTQLFQFR